ncbi:MAG: hypothetical protein PHW93_06505 [Candidatus Methanomethylophilaceae archaeon]|nr:hypothetical protein [Candidatus Methanomethylophilaceae archaeon]
MQPIIRITDYVEEYKTLVHDYYSKVNNIVYATYYQLNQDTTQYDPHYLQTYHKTGEFSGRKYKKIHMVPLTTIIQVLPSMDAAEKGVSFSYNTISAFTIDSSVKLVPHVGDISTFNINGDYVTWEVTNVEYSGPLDNPYYRCNIRQTRLREGFDDQIDFEYMYVEYAKCIYSITDATNFIYLMSRFTEVVHFLNSKSCYNHNLAYHIFNKNCFPEIENILNTVESLVPVGTLFMTHNYNTVVINPQSIFMLLCLPKVYDITKDPIFTFTLQTEKINPRANVYIHYKEYITDAVGSNHIQDIIDNALIEDRAMLLLTFLKNNTEEYMETYVKPSDDVFTNLIDEWIQFIYTNTCSYVSENKIATNMFEGVIEYCIISNKLISLLSKGGITLS